MISNETVILEGRYRIIRCLAHRPRVNLYLGRRLAFNEELASPVPGTPEENPSYEALVAIRELVLTQLDPHIRSLIEAAAFEEFVRPSVFGSSHLPTAGDRVWIEGEQHYLVMQLSDAKMPQFEHATTLNSLLLANATWPRWIDEKLAIEWAIQLSRMVARLHHQGIVLGNLTPSSILVDGQKSMAWAPILLPSWPPAPSYWKTTEIDVPSLYALYFPIVYKATDTVFAAPELLNGVADERSDVYALGAILYLLLTHYAPISASHRQRVYSSMSRRARSSLLVQERADALELIPPRFFNENVSPLIEAVVLQTLELEPAKRYATAFALVEALEALVGL
jgi:serine/threonine protein kinase